MRVSCSLRLRRCAVALLLLCTRSLTGADEGSAEEAFRAGSRALHARDYEQAVASFELAARLRPQHADTWLELGIARSALADWDGALEAYGRLIEIDPTQAKAHHNSGNVNFRRGRFDEAVLNYARALELDPGYGLAAFHVGWTLRQLGRSEEAERAFRACLALPAADATALRTRVDCTFGLGSIRHRAGDYAASAAMMEQVLSVHPGHPEARYYLGLAYRQLGRLEQAERQLAIHRELLAQRRHQAPGLDRPDDP